jgi:hypothetical protein
MGSVEPTGSCWCRKRFIPAVLMVLAFIVKLGAKDFMVVAPDLQVLFFHLF